MPSPNRPQVAALLRKAFALAVGLISLASFATETEVQKKHRLVADCFFVYAPLYQIGRIHDIPALKAYALPRLKYIQGYMDALKADREFEAVFADRLPGAKRQAETLSQKLETAIATGDSRLYNDQLQVAELCDSVLGVKTDPP